MVTTATATAFWTAARSPEDLSAWLAHYLASADAPYRTALIQALRPYAPLASLLEVGCHCGPNLKALAPHCADLHYTGLDVNAAALAFGRQQAMAQGYGAHAWWVVGNLLDPQMEDWPARSHEVVLASSVLMYLHPTDLPQALRTMARLADRLVVMQEPRDGERHGETYHQWTHDLADAWTDAGIPGFLLSTTSDGIVIAERR